MTDGIGFLRRKDLLSLGYQKVDLGGTVWLANKRGLSFVRGVDDWSPQRLASRKGWSFWDKGSHALYVTEDFGGVRFFVKVYHVKKSSGRVFPRRLNKAKNEFQNTLFSYKKGFRTILPLALGQGRQGGDWSAIIYPFLDNSVALDRAYPRNKEPACLSVLERQSMEKSVGSLLRRCIDSGIFPANMCLGHFLARREVGRGLVVYWVDFEKVKFRTFFKERFAIKTVGKLLARIEWFRISGGRISRSSVMRIGHACFYKKGSGPLDRKLCRAVIQATKKYWEFRKIDSRGLYPLESIQPIDQVRP